MCYVCKGQVASSVAHGKALHYLQVPWWTDTHAAFKGLYHKPCQYVPFASEAAANWLLLISPLGLHPLTAAGLRPDLGSFRFALYAILMPGRAAAGAMMSSMLWTSLKTALSWRS